MIHSRHMNKVIAIAISLSILASLFLLYAANETGAAYMPEYQRRLFGDEIITIDIQVDPADWDDMIANASAKEYIMADVIINGTKIQSAGIRPKGNASLSQVSSSTNPERYSLHLSFDEYVKKQTFYGLDALILNNMITDTTYMKEYMSQDIMRYIGVEAPLTNYASISVNGEPYGFYVALEYYGTGYLNRVYGDSNGNLYNVKTMNMGGMGGGARGERNQNANAQLVMPESADWNDRLAFVGGGGGSAGGTLQYTDDELTSYSAIFDNAHGSVTQADQQKVITALKNLSEGTALETYFDIDGILRYFAAHTVVVNLDSYSSSMAQNYFVQERDGQITILPWDYHLSYGGFQSGSASDVVNFPIDTPVSGVTMESRPLLDQLLSVSEYSDRYHAYLQEIVDGYFSSGLFEETVRQLQEKIADYVTNDPAPLVSYDEFETGVDALINLNLLRAESIKGQLEGAIPSTAEGQSADSSALVDASSVTMSDLGSMGGMGGFGGESGMDFGNMPNIDMGDFDMAQMMEAMEILGTLENGALTEEQRAALHEMGLTDEQIEQLVQMAQFGMGGDRQGGMGGFPGNGNRPEGGGFPQDGNIPEDGSFPQDGSMPESGSFPQDGSMPTQGGTAPEQDNNAQWIVLIVLMVALIGGIAFMAFYKRR